MIEFGHSTHVGLRREHNEDTYYADANLGLWLVADGMGGHEHGEVASALARDTLVREVGKGMGLIPAIQLADEEIIRHSTRRSEALPMGTTIAALRLSRDGNYEVAWVGDSRIYIWNEGLKQLSQDHSYVQELIDQGAITSEQARHHPHRNVVTQALGVTDPQSLRDRRALVRGGLLLSLGLLRSGLRRRLLRFLRGRLTTLTLHVHAATEVRALSDGHAWRDDVAVDGSAVADINLLRRGHVAVDLAEHYDGLGKDLRFDLAVRADGEHVVLQLDLPLDLTLDGEIFAAVQLPLDDDGLSNVHHIPLDPPAFRLRRRRRACRRS